MLAFASGAHELAEALLSQGAKPDTVGRDATGPMSIAVLAGDRQALDLLIAAGADPNRAEAGMLPLELATLRGDPTMVEALVRAGADPERRNPQGMRPADFALSIGQPGIADLLGGASVRDEAIFEALRSGSLPELSAALKGGANPDARSANGNPAVFVAAGMGRADLLDALATAGADLLARGEGGASVIQAALSVDELPLRTATVRQVLVTTRNQRRQGQLLRLADESGRTGAVTLSARMMAKDSVGQTADETFLSALDPQVMRSVGSVADPDGVSPFTAAVLADNFQMTHYFSEKLGLPATTPGGQSLMEIARAQGSWAALAALPEDRWVPSLIRFGVPQDVFEGAKSDLQRMLHDWGYYAGEIDGIFGPASQAALAAFFQDRGKEVVEMARALSRDWAHYFEVPAADVQPGDVILRASLKDLRMSAEWTVVRWKPLDNRATLCIANQLLSAESSKNWIANSLAYLAFGETESQFVRTSDAGWEGYEVLD